MKSKIMAIYLISLTSLGMALGGKGKEDSEKVLLHKRLAAYDFYLKNSDNLGECTVRNEGARGKSIFFPADRSDVILIESEGIYFAVKVSNKKVKLLWSMCRAEKLKKLKKTQYKGYLWRAIAEGYEMGHQIGVFPDEFKGGYDIFWTDQHLGKATRKDKNGRKVCEYNNVNTGDMYIAAEPKITKLCKP